MVCGRDQRQHMLLQIKNSLLDALDNAFAVHEPVEVLCEDGYAVAGTVHVEVHA